MLEIFGEMSSDKKVLFILFGIFFVFNLLVLNPKFEGPDQPIYYAYTASVVEDGDLNAVNHIDEHYPYFLPSGKIGVSVTYNLPDFHNHGGVLLWIPFFIYGKLMYFLKTILFPVWNIGSREEFTNGSLTLSTGIFFILLCWIIYSTARIRFTSGIILLSLFVIFWGTPFFYYTLIEPGNANIIATLFSSSLILFAFGNQDFKKYHWFLYGVFFSICVIVKVDLWFYIIFIFFLWWYDVSRKSRLTPGIYFILGFLPGFVLKGVNDYMKYGYFHSGELGLINFKDCYLWEQLFSSYRGFFYTSPILYVTTVGFVLLLYFALRENKKGEDRFERILVFLWIMVIFKILVLSKRFAWGGGTCGARPLLTEYPVFVLSYAYVWQKCNRTFLKWLLMFISLICILWNFLVISEYMLGVDIENLGRHLNVLQRIPNIRELFSYLLSFKEITLKLTLGLPLLMSGCLILYIVKKKTVKPLTLKILQWFTIYLLSIYFIITLLNVMNNKKKVEKLKKSGFFQNCEVLKPEEYEKMENMGSMDEMIDYFSRIGDRKRVEKIRKVKRELYGK